MTSTSPDPYLELVCEALRDLGIERRDPALATANPETRLLGGAAVIDSFGLVSLLAELEARLAERFHKDVVLADERAMSAVRSPFRTVGALAAHVRQRIEAEP